MNKVLILSVKPQHAYNILNGDKTLELRKSVPNGYKGWVYVYVTKTIRDYKQSYYYQPKGKEEIFRLHGIIPCRFWFDEWEGVGRTDYVRTIQDRTRSMINNRNKAYNLRQVIKMREDYEYDECIDSCLTTKELKDYGKGKDLYAWHIKNLEIFPKPMQLGEFTKEEYTVMPNGIWPSYQSITKAPQSYMYAWVKEEMK